MENRRKFKRKYLVYPIRIFNPNTNRLIGFVENITIEGMLLKAGQPFPTNQTYQLKMLLGEETYKTGYFKFSAECKWWDKDNFTGFYNIGFQLKDVSFEGSQVLDLIIHKFCIDEKSF